jgi:cytochrome c biogenesis protein CcdA/thiol-disulfide isomerase/thioredoxin
MVILSLFAFVAGAATALSPCVLPVLPVALAAGSTGGRRRPLGVVTGLVVSFTFATVVLVYVISALGLPDDLLRNLAIAVLVVAGIALIVPGLAARVEVLLSRLTRRAPGAGKRDGFGSGVVLGASLGLVYAPCAGPILAGVITVSASQDFTAGRLAVALSYGLGTAVVLYALMLGGRRLIAPLARRSGAFGPAIGVVMVAVAILMAAELDLRFQNTIADDLPAALVNPTGELEESEAVEDRLADLRGGSGDALAEPAAAAGGDGKASDLPVLGEAPEIVGTQRWFNTPGGRPLSLSSLRGEVVLIDFWTYSCINCLRTLPYLRAWDERYRDDGLRVIGVHSPEFPFERDAANVEDAVRRNDLGYAVAQDNEFATWNAYGNRFWPAKYLIDAEGNVRYTQFGEGAYEETETAIRELLADAGSDRLGESAEARTDSANPAATPESYLGADRAERFLNGPITPGRHTFELPESAPERLPRDHLAYEGEWRIRGSHAVAGRDARLHMRYRGRKVFLVLGTPGGPRDVAVLVDGRRSRTVEVRGYRLHELVSLPRNGTHTLALRMQPGTKAYAFTFG